MIDNPIQNPADTEAAKSSMTIASSGQRLGNYILDLLFLYAFGFVFGLALYIIGLGDFVDQMNDTLFGFIIFLLYYVPQEAFFGWTLGKLITGTRVVDNFGLPISIGQAVGRGLCRFIPFEAFSFLGGGGSPVGWHDKIPKTLVVSIRKPK